MKLSLPDLLTELHQTLDGTTGRQEKARRAAAAIRSAGGYRWVGLYDVGPAEISLIAWDGPAAPTHLTFPVTQGLNGAAVASGEPVVVQDVANDPRYLTTLGDTRAEMIMPVRTGPGGAVLGTIDVESERINAFTERDHTLLAASAEALARLWTRAV